MPLFIDVHTIDGEVVTETSRRRTRESLPEAEGGHAGEDEASGTPKRREGSSGSSKQRVPRPRRRCTAGRMAR